MFSLDFQKTSIDKIMKTSRLRRPTCSGFGGLMHRCLPGGPNKQIYLNIVSNGIYWRWASCMVWNINVQGNLPKTYFPTSWLRQHWVLTFLDRQGGRLLSAFPLKQDTKLVLTRRLALAPSPYVGYLTDWACSAYYRPAFKTCGFDNMWMPNAFKRMGGQCF